MIVKHPWFGPKRMMGWGWTPISWEGWLVTVVCLAVVIAACTIFAGTLIPVYISIGAVGALIVVCMLTGLPPGGPN